MFTYIHDEPVENQIAHVAKSTTAIIFSIIKLLFISMIVLPGSLIAGLILLSYKFDFVAMSEDFYDYQSSMSQIAVQPGYINYVSCAQQAAGNIDAMPKPICDAQEIKSMPVRDAANSTGKTLLLAYNLLVVFCIIFYLMFTSSNLAFIQYARAYWANWQLKKTASDLGIKFFGNQMTLTIGSQNVSDFAYLIRYYSNGKIESFSDFHKIYSSRDELISAIDKDLENPRELQTLNVSKETADATLKSLKKIISAIATYTQVCIFNNVPIPVGTTFKYRGM